MSLHDSALVQQYMPTHRNAVHPLALSNLVVADWKCRDLTPPPTPTAGVYLYLLPMGHGNSKSDNLHHWGFPFHSFWCCYGTIIESYAKLADSIFFKWVRVRCGRRRERKVLQATVL